MEKYILMILLIRVAFDDCLLTYLVFVNGD